MAAARHGYAFAPDRPSSGCNLEGDVPGGALRRGPSRRCAQLPRSAGLSVPMRFFAAPGVGPLIAFAE